MLRTPVEKNEFMCCCDDEGEARCAEVRDRAKEIVESSSDLDFVNSMIYGLVLEGDLQIHADQWARVKMVPLDPPERIQEQSAFMCDNIVDGLAAAVVYYFGEDHG